MAILAGELDVIRSAGLVPQQKGGPGKNADLSSAFKIRLGEITLALRIAQRAVLAGFRCRFIAHEAVSSLIEQQGFAVEKVSSGVSEPFLNGLKRTLSQQDAVVLVDMYLTGTALFEKGIHPRQLKELDCRLIGIDTWNFGNSNPR